MIYDNITRQNTMSKFQHTETLRRNVCALLYYIHMTSYDQINFKFPHVLIIRFYRLVQFYTQGRFCASLSVRVSISGHPVTYVSQFCTNNTGQKYTAACQHAPHDIIRFYTILRFYIRRHFLRHSITCERKYNLRQNCQSLH